MADQQTQRFLRNQHVLVAGISLLLVHQHGQMKMAGLCVPSVQGRTEMTADAATAKAWTVLQGQIEQSRTRSVRLAGTRRHAGRAAAYSDLLDGMDRIVRTFGLSPADGWAEFRADVKRDRDLYDQQAADYSETPAGAAQSEHAYGRVEACDKVLEAMDSAEKEAGR